MRGVSLTHPVLTSFLNLFLLSGEFLLHIPRWLYFSVGSFSYTSCAGFIFMRGVSLAHPVLALFLSGELLLHNPCFLYFLWRVSLTHPVLASFLPGEFLLHIPRWLHFYAGSFSYTSHADFVFIWGVSLPHPMLS